MYNLFIKHIVKLLRNFEKQVVMVKNTDGFLNRKDVTEALSQNDIILVENNKLEQRIIYELRKTDYPNKILVFLAEDITDYLEDMRMEAVEFDFHLTDYFEEYHLPSIIDSGLNILDKLFQNKPLVKLSKKETNDYLKSLQSDKNANHSFDVEAFKKNIEILLNKGIIDWKDVIALVSKALTSSIEGVYLERVMSIINSVNRKFQKDLRVHYKQLVSSSPVKKPKIVSKILDYLDLSSHNKKAALIVIDGMSYWEYLLLSRRFPRNLPIKNDYIYSWIPSITQLSRQAIFKGGIPDRDYIQNPKNEERLWRSYWIGKGLREYEIRYDYEKVNFSGLNRITKLAVVFKDLDDKMHSSTDFKDLKSLTEHWIERSDIIETIKKLLEEKFTVYITSDHGNILAKGWRNLKGKEKLGTNKSGSRSQRHIEYSNIRLANKFLALNKELQSNIMQEENIIYFTNEYSFSSKESLITHGGSHILEVLIPFIKIDYEH